MRNDSRCAEPVRNDSRCAEPVRNDSRWAEPVRNDSRCAESVRRVWKGYVSYDTACVCRRRVVVVYLGVAVQCPGRDRCAYCMRASLTVRAMFALITYKLHVYL